MSRFMPIPTFHFSISSYTDEDTGHSWNTISLESKTNGSSNGDIILDDMDDLFILRSAIDRFISKHDLISPLEMAKKLKTGQPEPVCADYSVLEGYLKGWAPADSLESGVIMKTSREIASDLEDMVEIDAAVVAHALTALGFKAHFSHDGGPHGWMMRPDPAAIHDLRLSLPENEE